MVLSRYSFNTAFLKRFSLEFLVNRKVNSLPANWSEEKAKKESKKSCKNYLGVTDFEQIWFMISALSQTLTNNGPRSELEPLP